MGTAGDAPGSHDEGLVAITRLMQTPVGRRWLLRMGLTASAAAAMGVAVGSPADAAPLPTLSGPQDRILFQFALGAAKATDLEVWVDGQRVALTAHTAATRVKLRNQGSLFGKINTQAITHFADLRLPRDRGMVMTVHGTLNGAPVVVAQHMYAPVPGIRQVALAAWKLDRSFRRVAGSPSRHKRLGLDPSRLSSWQEVADLDAICDSEQSAVALTMLHPNVSTIGQLEVPVTKTLLQQTPEVETLGTTITTLTDNGEAYVTAPVAVDGSGQPYRIKIGDTLTTFQSNRLSTDNSTLQTNAKAALVAGVLGVRDTGGLSTVIDKPLDQLQDKSDTATRHTSVGTLPTSTPYTAATGLAAGQVTAQVQVPGLYYGTKTELGTYSGGTLPLTLYNNYVRWVWVYVQYFDASGKQLAVVKSSGSLDTDNAKSLGALPQVFTVLGIPIWDQNTVSPTLTFPPEATSARILFCGLGDDAVGGGWRQYFTLAPYSTDNVAPSKEVAVPSVITGVFTIGLNAFALAIQLDVTLTWKQLRTVLTTYSSDVFEFIDPILARPQWATQAEVVAGAAVAGAMTYEDVKKNGLNNLKSTLAPLGTLIPKLLFQPDTLSTIALQAAKIIVADIAEETVQKVLAAVSLVGLVMSALELAGDIATLAQAIGETVASPWVIANQISLTYPAKVTISKDPRAATWPATARTWRLDSTIDGATALNSVTGTLNPNGNSNADVVLNLQPPFGGEKITWSIVVLDAAGNQVGAGAVQPKNNDPANPATTVTFAITELPATVDSGTVFSRTITTAYQGSAGYGWVPAPKDTGTRAGSPIQGVVGVTVSTRLGVAGIVWKQNDKYWLRGVPVAESGGSIKLGGATKQGYARRPYLFFDALVGDKDAANHVLLEPDDTSPGYHLRALTIDPTSGALTWNSSSSLGYFALPVDDAALTASGLVVAVHTNSGRVGFVEPAGTAQPPLASYSAGPGSQPGLLQSPTAVTVTTPGTMLVLESGASQIAAFDIHGNPVRYFGTSGSYTFTIPLPKGRTYLDLAVDGSNQIYVLSYSGDGSQPGSYQIDVYTPAGAPLTTKSLGTNVAKLAVDYWRSIFAANFTPLLDAGTGQPHIDPALGVMEPSLSRLDPAG